MSAKSIVYSQLSTDSGILALVDIGNITQKWYDAVLGHPQITISRQDELGVYHGDNDDEVQGSTMQIDIWTTQSPTAIETEVKRSLREIPEYQRGIPTILTVTPDEDTALNRVTIQIIIYE